jgi:hypothetical protein
MIKLTGKGGEKVYINPALIQAIMPSKSGSGSDICFPNFAVLVEETPEEVVNVLGIGEAEAGYSLTPLGEQWLAEANSTDIGEQDGL